MDNTISSILAAALAALLTVIGSWVVKRTKSPEAPSLEQKLMDEWEQIAVESRKELTECRTERVRQDQKIEAQDGRITQLVEDLAEAKQTFEKYVTDLRREISQWRNGQRVPEGYVLQRSPIPPPGS